MFCTNCGFKQENNAKFCQKCGNKVCDTSVDTNDRPEFTRIEIMPMATNLTTAKIQLSSFEAEGPDEDNSFRVTVRYSVTNDSKEDWEYCDTYTQIFNATGQIIEEMRDSREQTIRKGETIELESYFWGIRSELFGTNAEKSIVVLSFTASEFAQQKLGEVKIPENHSEMISIKPAKIDSLLSLVSCSIWKTEPDDDRDCRVEIKALIQNHTSMHLPEVKIVANISDLKGREVTDASFSEGIRPGALSVISGSGYTKEKKLIGASVDLALRAYWPVALGVDQRQGMAISKTENEEFDNINEDENSSDNINDFVDRYNLIPATIMLEENLSCDADVLSIIKTENFDLSLESRLIEYDDYVFLVNVHAKNEKIIIQREDAKKIAYRLGKYIFDFRDNNIHSSLHNDFDQNISFQIYVALDDEVIYNLEVKNKIDKSLKSSTENSKVLQRKAIFTFSHRIKSEIDSDAISELCSITKCNSTKSLQALCPSGNRNSKTEEAYQRLDQQILPHMSFAVFFDNFSDPSLIFVDPKELYLNTTEIDSRLRGARITYFALWESDSSDGRQLEVAVEVSVELDVVEGIDVENPYDDCESEVEDQFRECSNMFNFFFNEFEFEDDDGLNHEWSATFISE